MLKFHHTFFLLALLIPCSGCGGSADGPELGRVQGSVTLDGTPLKNATVSFNPVDGSRSSTGLTDEEGHYSLDFTHEQSGAIVGDHQVSIHSEAFEGEAAKDPLLPARYNQQTELMAKVESGSNSIDFPLETGKAAEPVSR